MKKYLLAAALFFAFCIVADRPANAQEIVYYLLPDTRKEGELTGKIKAESAGGVTITVGKQDKVVPALDIIQVAYKTAKTGLSDYRTPYGSLNKAMDPKTKAADRRDLFAKALDGFAALAATDLGDSPSAARYVRYRIADVQYRMAMDDVSQRGKAIAALEEYATANPGGWEILPALQNLGRLHEDAGDLEKARIALERISDLPDVPKDIKRAGDSAVSQMLMRAKIYDKAEDRLNTLLASLPPGDPQRASTQIYLVQAQIAQKKGKDAEKQLKDAITASNDPLLRGIAYNVLGDLYRENRQTEEAFWAYLRVDTMYNQDAAQHAKAIYYLSDLLKEKKFGDRTGDPIRAKSYREKLQDKRFADTEYPKLAEKMP
jgi:tetratricopeptide (TPR) repeat protein